LNVSETFYDAQTDGGWPGTFGIFSRSDGDIVEPTKLSSGFWSLMIAAA
jgi:hypothetical protein